MASMSSRKGLLATVITLLSAFPLLLLILTTTDAIRQTQTTFAVTEAGPRMTFYTEDVIQDHRDLLGWSVSLAEGDRRWMNVSSIGRLGSDWRSRFDDYNTFLAQRYAPTLNIIINVSGTPLPANITPVGYTLTSADDLLIAPTSAGSMPWLNITAIDVAILINQSSINLSTNSTPANNGAAAVRVSIIGTDNQEMLERIDAALDPAASNLPFYATFADGSRIDVTFGTINGTAGTLLVRARNLEANVSNLGLQFLFNGTPILETGSTLLVSSGDLNRTSKIAFG